MNIILERVNEVCKSVRENNQGLITFKKLIGQTRATFKRHEFDIHIRTKKESGMDGDKFYVMAYYDPDDDLEGETPIEVVVHHNLEGDEQFGPHQVTSFLTEIYDAVVHEYRHQYQSMRRDFKEYVHAPYYPYEEYLASQDELDAYAMSIAIEIMRNMEVSRARRNLCRISIMSKMRTGSALTSPMLRAYIEHFGLCPLTKRLAKKVYKHLETLDKRHIFV